MTLRAEQIDWTSTPRERRERTKPTALHTAPAPNADPFPATEAGDAEFFVHFVAGRWLYDHSRQQWFAFGPHHWRPDVTVQVVQTAIAAMRQRQAHALTIDDEDQRKKRLRWAIAGESEARIRHLLELAESSPQLGIEGADWDQDAWLLGVGNGVVDLQTGTLRPGGPEDRVTRVAAVSYNAAATCARWDRFVLEISDGDVDLAAFLQRSIGSALTGSTSEHVFWILYGLGANGKTTFLETLTRHVIPEHAWTMSFPVHTWAESMSEYQRAELVGRRLVIAKESEQTKRLNTEFVKSLTGGDTVNARHPYGRPFTFVPTAKFILACNHQPIIRDESHGMWRRVRLVPFTRTFPVDPTFGDLLAAEAPGILRWAIDGCLMWQHDRRLAPPAVVRIATAEYERESDTFASFVAAWCTLADYAHVRAGTLYDAYTRWCEAQKIPEADRLSLRTFGARAKRTYPPQSAGRHVTYTGIGLRQPEEE